MPSPVEIAADRVSAWRRDPVRYVREEFGVEPDEWQKLGLVAVADMNQRVVRLALLACVGPGKTALLAWIACWFFTVFGRRYEHPKGAAVSTTRENLDDNLKAEIAAWRNRSQYLLETFDLNDSGLFARSHPDTWFLSFRSWSRKATKEEQGKTLSGLHAPFVLVLYDESGDIPPSVADTGEQAMTNCQFGRQVQAGNPIDTDGMLYMAATRDRDLWKLISITGDPDDPLCSPRVNKELNRRHILQRGRGDLWVMTHILGKFPPSALNSILTLDEVERALHRSPRRDQYDFAARILGVDVAREGLDDSVMFPRQGIVAFPPTCVHGYDSTQGAGMVARKWDDWQADACFVDNTGGFGGGWIDRLRELHHDPLPVVYSGKANDKRYFNKRAEIVCTMADWVRDIGALPNVKSDQTNLPELVQELTAIRYMFHRDQYQIEDKDDIKDRIGRSPNYTDALAETFAQPVRALVRTDLERYEANMARRRAKMIRDPYYDGSPDG